MNEKLTLDMNCLISLENDEPNTNFLKQIVELHDFGKVDIAFPAISGNEKLRNKSYSDNIESFRARVKKISKREIDILKPISIWNLSFWDYCLWETEELKKLDKKIQNILFPNIPSEWLDYAKLKNINPEILDAKWVNARCDVMTIWCHIYNDRDIFITNDENFLRSKKGPLIDIGAKSIQRPEEFIKKFGY